MNRVPERVEFHVRLVMDEEKKMWVLPKELPKDAPDLKIRDSRVHVACESHVLRKRGTSRSQGRCAQSFVNVTAGVCWRKFVG